MKYLFAFLATLLPFSATPQEHGTDARARVAMAMSAPVVEVLPLPLKPSACPCPKCSCDDCQCTGGVCKCEACTGAVWHSYADGYAEAKRTGRPCVIVVSTAACPPCRQLEATLATVDLTGFVAIKVDANAEPSTAAALMSSKVPHTLVIGADGNTRTSRVGPLTADQIRADLATGRLEAVVGLPGTSSVVAPSFGATRFGAPSWSVGGFRSAAPAVRRGGC